MVFKHMVVSFGGRGVCIDVGGMGGGATLYQFLEFLVGVVCN